jgi:Dullard-like phosphatase family protein
LAPDEAHDISVSKNEKKFHSEFEEVLFDYVESSLNYQGNYQNYVYRALKSIIPLRKLNYAEQMEIRRITVPENVGEKRKTLILDLDETLIHADFDRNYSDHDSVVNFTFDGEEIQAPILIRPGLYEFLDVVREKFEIFIFTASVQQYADSVLNMLDPENKYFKNRFYRNSCICVKSKVYVKDLRIFANRKQENLVMVDNSMYSFTNQISNGILINSFYNDREDRELYNLLNYLMNYLPESPDVRNVNEQVFNFNSIIDDLSQN